MNTRNKTADPVLLRLLVDLNKFLLALSTVAVKNYMRLENNTTAQKVLEALRTNLLKRTFAIAY